MTSPHISGADGAPYLPSLISVLVLDDQRFDRHKINRLCDTLPMACEVSQADCLSAFDVQLNTGAYDLVFLDYNLPDGSGIDALDMIRKSARNSNATSIMVTGFPEDAIEVEAKHVVALIT